MVPIFTNSGLFSKTLVLSLLQGSSIGNDLLTKNSTNPKDLVSILEGMKNIQNITSTGNSSLYLDEESSVHNLIQNAPYRMSYNISNEGKSTFRNLSPLEQIMFRDVHPSSSSSIRGPLWIMLYGESGMDKAHECILGVNMTNIEEAEYAATHPGETSWSVDHPLDAAQTMLHALIHRLEGPFVGEGGYTGYENSKYWYWKAIHGDENDVKDHMHHPVGRILRDFVRKDRYECLSLISNTTGRTYEIISGGGKKRNVHIDNGEFDYYRFVDLCAMRYNAIHCTDEEREDVWAKKWTELIDEIQDLEVYLLLQL